MDDRSFRIFNERYALKGESSVEETFQRVASFVAVGFGVAGAKKSAVVRRWTDRMNAFDFVPAGRILSGATPQNGSMINCYVVPIEDSLEGIFSSLSSNMKIQSRGGGVGTNFGPLRPKGFPTRGRGTASGPCSYMDLYDHSSQILNSTHKRKASNMAIIPVWHPDIEEVIVGKLGNKGVEGRWTSFNISVGITNEFMDAVVNGKKFDLKWDGKVVRNVEAAKLWELIVQCQWSCGDPGLWHIDRANELSNTYYFENIVATNPCGEQSLPPWGTCCLGSINLSNMVDSETKNWDTSRVEETTSIAVEFLDSVIEVNQYLMPVIDETAKKSRRVGIGVMGLAHALIKMGLRYDSGDGRGKFEEVMTTIRDAAYQRSTELVAVNKKKPFLEFSAAKYLDGEYMKKVPQRLRILIKKHGIRNAQLLTIAPTGTTSLIAGASSGIEPVFALRFKQRAFQDGRWTDDEILDPMYEKWKNAHGEEPPPEFFVTSHDIHPMDHLKMQLVGQQLVDNSISKTINLPERTTPAEISSVCLHAMTHGAKGCTVYRYGSLEVQAMNKTDKESRGVKFTSGKTYSVHTPQGKAYVTINDDDDGNPFSVFIRADKPGSDSYAYCNAIGRLISIALQDGADPERIEGTLIGINSTGVVWERFPGREKPAVITSVPDAVGKLMRFVHRQSKEEIPSNDTGVCEECGATIELSGGCSACHNCGATTCGG